MQISTISLLLISPLLLFILLLSMAMANDDSTPQPSGEAAVHIVYTEKPENEDAEAFNIKTLASVLGSEDAAKEAILYNYKHAASGFSAKLTPAQVEELSKFSEIFGDVQNDQSMRVPHCQQCEDVAVSWTGSLYSWNGQPGVLQVVPSRTLQLHSGPGKQNI